ncbi:hypothetical protein [Sphingomonas sp.]|nr:hypothetical protein [Sphingomonas sp.]
MSPIATILLVAGTTGLVVYLVTRRRGPRVTVIETRPTDHSDPE